MIVISPKLISSGQGAAVYGSLSEVQDMADRYGWIVDGPRKVTAKTVEEILDDPNVILVRTVTDAREAISRFETHQRRIYKALTADLDDIEYRRG
ncbi:hypothetical protein [Acaricomes phytoseiuli]|uniref:hypothetical protein n=1 Tax=Acaricomes phytoseiuli TaxID=291968 RepID=UPI000377FAE7|nr:hypothetical protein [Acaricomes phytoseiuli]